MNIYHVNGRVVRNAAFGEVLLQAPMAGGDFGRLPTAHACFNTLDLPAYATEAELRAKIQIVLTEAQGFHEGAVAM